MICPNCGTEMLVYCRDEEGRPVYVCRNPKCPEYDKRLKKE